MKLSGTITLGSVLSICTMIVGLSMGYSKMQARQDENNRRMLAIETLAAAREVRIRANEIALASQSSDLRNIQAGIDDIKATLTRLSEKAQ